MGQKIKEVQAKKLVKSNRSKFSFREFVFLEVLNFFPVQKLIFGHFWNCKKWNLVKKNFVKLIYLISWVFYLAWTFLNFLAHCVLIAQMQRNVKVVFDLLILFFHFQFSYVERLIFQLMHFSVEGNRFSITLNRPESSIPLTSLHFLL